MNGAGIKLCRAVFKICGLAVREKPVPNEYFKVIVDYPDKVYSVTSRYGLAQIVWLALEKAGKSDKAKFAAFYAAARKAEENDRKMLIELRRVCELFDSEKILYIPLKGAVLSDLYPESMLRTRCDIDILVPESEVKRAVTAVKKNLPYRREGRTAYDIEFVTKNGVHVELHYNVSTANFIRDSESVLSDIWNFADRNVDSYRCCLKPDMLRFLHVAHMAKHFEKGGCGVRPFLDLSLLNGKFTNNEGYAALLKKAGLVDFASVCDSLSRFWFEGGGSPGETVVKAEKFILNGGMFGGVANMVAAGKARDGGKAGYVMRRLILPFSQLRRKYPVLYRCPYLAPIMQCRRFCEMIANGHFRRSLSELKAAGRDYGETAELFGLLGLTETRQNEGKF